MPTTTIPTTSLFATKDTPADEVRTLIKLGLELAGSTGTVAQSQLDGKTSIKYNRGWLIVRRAWLEVNAPELLVEVPAQRADEPKAAYEVRVGRMLVELRSAGMSWGELAVRVGKPENWVRHCFNLGGNQKDKGLRIGRGGRYAYDDPSLYVAHRVHDGAIIPVELKGRPSPEQLVNAEERKPITAKADPDAVKPARKATKKAAAKKVAAA